MENCFTIITNQETDSDLSKNFLIIIMPKQFCVFVFGSTKKERIVQK